MKVVGRARLRGYEWLWLLYGSGAICTVAFLAHSERLPGVPAVCVLSGLSALSVHFNTDADDGGKISASAQSVVAAAAVIYFRGSAPLLGPLLVGMAAAFWRVPLTRHQWFSILGNFGAFGLPALGAAAVVRAFGLGAHTSALALAAIALPASFVLASTDIALVAVFVSIAEQVSLRKAARTIIAAEIASAGGGYVPFLFGAFVGELALQFGLVVFAFAVVAFVMVQAVFAGIRKLITSERDTCDGLIAAVERKDPYTAGHSKRVVRYARYMGTRLGFKGRDLARLEKQALMHDVGKLAVPNHVLRKPGKLEPDERTLMFRHEPAGEAILAQIPLLALSADIAAGRGHNDGLDGAVRSAHVVHAADAFDAMTSTRAYRRAKRQDDALAEMRRCAGAQFHAACVDALTEELDARGEVYGDGGIEADVIVYDTPPPEGALGETLAMQAAADATPIVERPPVEIQISRTAIPRSALIAIALAGVAIVAGAGTATIGVTPAFALAALVALGELVCLRPLRGAARPLSLVAVVTALRALTLPVAGLTAVTGIAISAALEPEVRTFRRLTQRAAATAATVAAYALCVHAWPGDASEAAVIGSLLLTTAAGLAVHGLLARAAGRERLADLALLACAPLTALATVGVGAHHGLGLGALPILVVPLALLVHGLDRTRLAHENLFAWIRAASLAPEHAALVPTGRAERIAQNAVRVARVVGLDDEMRDQLAAAAWMERVGECCLDDPSVIGRAHREDEIVEESAAILESTNAFHTAGQVLYASVVPPQVGGTSAIERAGQILRVAIAFEDATAGTIVPDQVPDLVALLRHSTHHAVDPELCDVLQQVVAPGSRRSTWQPVQTHAILSCGCVGAVDDFGTTGEDARCDVHGAVKIGRLAVDAVRAELADRDELVDTVMEMLRTAQRTRGRAHALLRELFVRLVREHVLADRVAMLAWAGYQTGTAWEHDVAHWLREADADPARSADVLTRAGTTAWDALEALKSAYGFEALAPIAAPVAAH